MFTQYGVTVQTYIKLYTLFNSVLYKCKCKHKFTTVQWVWY